MGPNSGIDDRRRADGRHSGPDRRAAGAGRRQAPRMRTLKGAEIVPPRGAPLKCTVRNISETGACIQLHSPVFLHHTFDVLFDDGEWFRRSCHVMWRQGLQIGVEFDAPEPEGGPIKRAIQRLLGKSSGAPATPRR